MSDTPRTDAESQHREGLGLAFGKVCSDFARQLERDLAQRTAELEIERLRLTACAVVANANTPDTAATERLMHPDYRSAAFADVARAVDREMALRADLAQRTAERDEARREVCLAKSNPWIVEHHLTVAIERGWDCWKEAKP
jgi:hypothetical protein